MLKDHNRLSYSGITTKKSYEWPGGKRIAVYVALNIEHFPFGEGGGIDLDRETNHGVREVGYGANTETELVELLQICLMILK